MRPIDKSYTPLDDDTDYFANDITGAGPFTPTTTLVSDGLGHQVTIDSAANLSGITFTLTGLDADGLAQTEAVTGPNATTVASAKYFSSLTSVSVSSTLGANTADIGVKDDAVSPTFVLDYTANPFSVGLMADVSGTIDYTVQYTIQNVFGSTQPSALTWLNHATMAAQTADAVGNYAFNVQATRLLINSLTAGATIRFSIMQGG